MTSTQPAVSRIATAFAVIFLNIALSCLKKASHRTRMKIQNMASAGHFL